jgi:hypothetical protein
VVCRDGVDHVAKLTVESCVVVEHAAIGEGARFDKVRKCLWTRRRSEAT